MKPRLYSPEPPRERTTRKVSSGTRSFLLMGIAGDWIVCISMSAGESRTMETLKLIKAWRRPLPPKQLVTGQSPAGSTEAPAAARQRLEVPSLLRLCVIAAALQNDRQNPQKSMDAQQRHQHRGSAWLLLLCWLGAVWRLIWLLLTVGFERGREKNSSLERPFQPERTIWFFFWMAETQTAALTATCNSKHRSRRTRNDFQDNTKSLKAETR